MRRHIVAALAALILPIGIASAAMAEQPPDPREEMNIRKEVLRDLERWWAVAEKNVATEKWYAAVAAREAAEAEARRLATLVEEHRQAEARAQAEESGRVPSGGGGGCVPDYIVQRESGGDYAAENPTSTASGKYQFLDSTWNGYGGYTHASDAPPAVQDAKACELWDNGNGSSHWALTR